MDYWESEQTVSKSVRKLWVVVRRQLAVTTKSTILPHLDVYRTFPRPLGEIINAFGVQELDLVFTRGRWFYEAWGQPIMPISGHGVELVAWLSNENSSRYVF